MEVNGRDCTKEYMQSSPFSLSDLSYPTPLCTGECRGYCGYCREHERVVIDEYRDIVVGKRGQRRLFISTSASTYPNVRTTATGIQFGRVENPKALENAGQYFI